MTVQIRPACSHDGEEIRSIYLKAFSGEEADKVATLAENLLLEKTTPKTYSLVAAKKGELAGHIAFSPAMDQENQCAGYILAPLAVKPVYHKMGVASKLIERGFQQLRNNRVKILFVYGDPKFYHRFGFKAEIASNYTTPYQLQYPFGWLATLLDSDVNQNRAGSLTCVSSLQDPSLW